MQREKEEDNDDSEETKALKKDPTLPVSGSFYFQSHLHAPAIPIFVRNVWNRHTS
jgi:hypothetical protein